jgi:hypothetical protein
VGRGVPLFRVRSVSGGRNFSSLVNVFTALLEGALDPPVLNT